MQLDETLWNALLSFSMPTFSEIGVKIGWKAKRGTGGDDEDGDDVEANEVTRPRSEDLMTGPFANNPVPLTDLDRVLCKDLCLIYCVT